MAVDQNAIAAVVEGIKPIVNTFTYFGVNIGGYVTDAEYAAVATAAIQAYLDFTSSPKI
jgi:hypothetical protein